jgi:hypothetical protein
MCGAATSSGHDAVLDGIGSHVTFKRSTSLTKLFYASDIDQCAQHICVFAQSYIESCLAKLGWETRSASSSLMPPLAPAVLKSFLSPPPSPLDPAVIAAMADKHGFPYCAMTGMLIFAVQIGRFDIAPTACILCKFNERPSDAHFQAAKNVMKYLCATSHRSLIYWRPTGRERQDLPLGEIIPMRPERGIADKFQTDFPSVEPVCFVNASYAGLLPIGEHCYITGIVICLGDTALLPRLSSRRLQLSLQQRRKSSPVVHRARL